MNLTELKITDFIQEVASKSPAPGGGSVSALAASNGLALSQMVGALTTGKKKYKELDEEIKTKFENCITRFSEINDTMINLIDEDTKAFNLIMEAFKLPKETDEEKQVRNEKIVEGTKVAINVPLEVATLSLEAMELLDTILHYGNKNTLSDIGVSTLMLYAGLEGAILNVKINIPGLPNESERNEFLQRSSNMLLKAKDIKDNVLNQIHQRI